MSVAKGLKVVGYFDCPGGGQVVVRDNVAYIGHVKPPDGTTLIDVSDPANPRKLSEIKVPEGTLSHKVRVDNGIMLVNREIYPIGRKDPDFLGGLEVYDIAKPSAPRHIGSWPTSHHGHPREGKGLCRRWPRPRRRRGHGLLVPPDSGTRKARARRPGLFPTTGAIHPAGPLGVLPAI